MPIRPMPTRPSHGDWSCTPGGLLLQPGLIRQIMRYTSKSLPNAPLLKLKMALVHSVIQKTAEVPVGRRASSGFTIEPQLCLHDNPERM